MGLAFVLLALPGQEEVIGDLLPRHSFARSGDCDERRSLTTVVMTSVGADRTGVASGVNNAVARVAALLAIAIFGVVMLNAFNIALDRRLDTLGLSPESRRQLDIERAKLAAMEPPPSLGPDTAANLRRAVADSFIVGFRRLLTLAAALAVLGALITWLVIENKSYRRSGGETPPG